MKRLTKWGQERQPVNGIQHKIHCVEVGAPRLALASNLASGEGRRREGHDG